MKLQMFVLGLALVGCSPTAQTLPVDPETVKRCESIWESGGWDSLDHCVTMQTETIAMANEQVRRLGLD